MPPIAFRLALRLAWTRRRTWWLLGCAGAALALMAPGFLLIAAVLAVTGLLAGAGHWFAAIGQSILGLLAPTPPAIATPYSRPAEWLPTLDTLLAQMGLSATVPNELALAVVQQASGGQALSERAYCANGRTTGNGCAATFGAGVATVGVGHGLFGLTRTAYAAFGASLDTLYGVASNLRQGLTLLNLMLQGPYLKDDLQAFHIAYQTPGAAWASGAAYADQIRQAVTTYESGPQLGAWALDGWNGQTGAWQSTTHPVPVFVVGVAPTGPVWSRTWKPPTRVCMPVTNENQTLHCIWVPHVLTGHTLTFPVDVSAVVDGRTIPFHLAAGGAAADPVWPGGTVWAADLPVSDTDPALITATFAGQPALSSSIFWPAPPPGVIDLGPGPVTSTPAADLAPWWPLIRQAQAHAAAIYGIQVPLAVIGAVIAQESSGDPNAVSPTGAIGLMQVEPSTAAHLPGWHAGLNLFDPATNLQLGVEYLAQNYRAFGSWRLTFAAYYTGAGGVAALLRQAGIALPTAWTPAVAAALNVYGPPTVAQYAEQVDRRIPTIHPPAS